MQWNKKELVFPMSPMDESLLPINVILISGKAGAGKDTSAEILKEHLRARNSVGLVHSFAYSLKSLCLSDLFGWDGQKDVPGRNLLTKLGTDVAHQLDNYIWVRRWYEDIMLKTYYSFSEKPQMPLFAIAPDWRFPTEVEFLRFCPNLQVFTLRIDRDLRLKNYHLIELHPSEVSLDSYPFHCIIRNNETLDDLERELAGFLDGIQKWVI